MTYFLRSSKCDDDYCFRKIHTTFYGIDAAGLETPVLALCEKHSDTSETEIVLLEENDKQRVELAIKWCAENLSSFGMEDILKYMFDTVHVSEALSTAVRKYASHCIATMAMKKHYA